MNSVYSLKTRNFAGQVLTECLLDRFMILWMNDGIE